MKVVVSHPRLQYSHELAEALAGCGSLHAFYSGVPIRAPSESPDAGWARLRTLVIANVPREMRHHYPLFPFLDDLARKLPLGLDRMTAHRLDHAFDALVANRIQKLRPEVVVCYENAALRSFRAAKAVGATCILDAASLHHRTAELLRAPTTPPDPAFLKRRKDDEVELADGILTCSQLAADSYIQNGVDKDKVHAVPLGTHLPEVPSAVVPDDGLLRFVFVGSFILRKGADLLLEVFEQLAVENAPVRLTIIGAAVDPDLESRAAGLRNVHRIPYLGRDALYQEIAHHHCMVLPSRFDSFGMVVPEGMAVGLPALITRTVGAKCILEKHPSSGWLCDPEVASLEAAVRTVLANRAELGWRSAQAREAAKDFTWANYHVRVAAAVQRIHEARGR